MRYTQSNSEVVNDVTISDGVIIEGTAIKLTNSESGRIIGGVVFAQGGNTLVNEAGGILRITNGANEYGTAAISGSTGNDIVINAGSIFGLVDLGDGADILRQAGSSNNADGATSGRIDFGAGEDVFELSGTFGQFPQANGGTGRDRISFIHNDQRVFYGTSVAGFEDLALIGSGQFVNFSGYQTITLGTRAQYGIGLIDSSNPLADVALAGNDLRLFNASVRSINGSDAAERVELGSNSAAAMGVVLGGGNDTFSLSNFFAANADPVLPVAGVSGGAGVDNFLIQTPADRQLIYDFTQVTGFEKLSISYNNQTSAEVQIANASGFTAIDLGSLVSLTLKASVLPASNVNGGFGGAITLEAEAQIGRYGFPLDGWHDQSTNLQQADDRLSVAFTNRGRVDSDIRFYIGDDVYDGSAGNVGGTVYGNAGNDALTGGAGAERFEGGFGVDKLSGGGGADFLSGGAGRDELSGGLGADVLVGGMGLEIFRGTRAEFAEDVIADFERGETIWITDADPVSFSFAQSGNVLDFGDGHRLTVNGLSGRLEMQAVQGGGVELVLTKAVRSDVNGDGRADILWRHDNGALTNWLGRADGGFVGNDAVAFHNVPTSLKVAGVADFNGDGRNDILWRGADGALTNWLGRADGGFIGNDAAAFGSVPASWKVAGTGDFNGDGRADILWRHDNGALTDWLGRADGSFVGNDAAALFANIPTNLKIADVADFNGDGRDDILWRGTDGALTNWLGRTDGGFVGNDQAAFSNVSTSWEVAGAGDFNGDGRADILWRHDNGVLTNWLGRVDGGFTGNDAAAFHNVPTSLEVAGVADYNGDGRADILWRGADGALTNWLGRADGGFTGNDVAAFFSVPTNWHIQLQDLPMI